MSAPRSHLVQALAVSSMLTVLCLAAAAPARATPVCSGSPELERSGRTLTASWRCSSALPPISYSYEWLRCTDPTVGSCGPGIAGTGRSYLLTSADIGLRLRARVKASDLAGPPAGPAFSNAEGPVAPSPPVNQNAPAVTGTPRRDLLLGSSLGTWSDPSPANVSYTRQWLRCSSPDPASCGAIDGATSPTYQLGAADVGNLIRVRVTATGLGSSSAESTPVGPVEDLPAPGAPSEGDGGGSTPPPGEGGQPRAPARGGARAGPRRLRPFPVVVIAGSLRRGTTRISTFLVRGPKGARVSVRCRGRGCPFRRARGTIGRRRKLRLRRAERGYRVGAVIEVRVTARNRIGKFTRIRIRRGRAPARLDACLRPGARRPSRC